MQGEEALAWQQWAELCTPYHSKGWTERAALMWSAEYYLYCSKLPV